MEEEWWFYTHSNGKRYRYSKEKRVSGRPKHVFLNVGSTDDKWVIVRNIDTLDSIWNVAEGLPWDHNSRHAI